MRATAWIRWSVALVSAAGMLWGCDGRGRAGGSTTAGGATADPGTAAANAERFDGEEFSLWAQPVEGTAVGTEVKVPVWVTPKDPWKVNVEYPAVKVQATGDEGVTVPEEALRAEAAARYDEHELRFEVPVTPTAAGEHRVTLKMKFGLCSGDRCVVREGEIAVAVRAGS
jgi:hypothetical protein